MTNFWLWLSVAGLGALHGLNPANGWIFAAAWGVRSKNRVKALRALMPIAIGHVAAIALAAGAVALGLSLDRVAMQIVAVVLLLVIAAIHLSGRKPGQVRLPAGHASLALWSFIMSSAHGAGLMMVPVMFSVCTANAASREVTASGSLMLALAAVGVHTTALLVVTGAVAAGACRAFGIESRWIAGLWR